MATLEQLPPVDIVLLSHDHYDHLCNSIMRKLARLRVPIVTSLGVGERVEKLGVDPTLPVRSERQEWLANGRHPEDRNRDHMEWLPQTGSSGTAKRA